MRIVPICCLAVLLAGCNPYTYINVPDVDGGDIARSDANSVTVREVESAAVRAMLEKHPVAGPFVVILPEGTTTLTYEVVIPSIADNAVIPGSPADVDSVATFDVQGVRIRGLEGEVDIQRIDTSLGGKGELFTVHMRYDAMEGWYGKRIHNWGMITDKPAEPTDSAEPEPVEPDTIDATSAQ